MALAPPLGLIESADDARELLDPIRNRILQLARKPISASEIARVLAVPRQRVGYHIRELEKRGFLKCVSETRRGNCVERLLQASAQHYALSPQVLGLLSLSPEEVTDRFSSTYLMALAGRTLHEVGELQVAADNEGTRLPTLALESEIEFVSPKAQQDFAEELTRFLHDLASRYHREGSGGRRFRFLASGYPREPLWPASGQRSSGTPPEC